MAKINYFFGGAESLRIKWLLLFAKTHKTQVDSGHI